MLKRLLTCGLIGLCCVAALANPRYDKFRKAGDQAIKRKDYATAIKEFERLVYLFPDDPEAYNALGYAYYLDGRYASAILQFKQTMQLRPNHPAALNNLMLAVAKQAQEQTRDLEFSEAISLLAATENLYPGHPQSVVLHYNRGQLEFYRGNEEAGLKTWGEVARRVPSSGTARFIEAHKLYAAGKPKEALPAMQAAAAKLPKEPVVRNYLGLILADLGKYQQSVAQFQKGQQGDPPYIDLYTNLAGVYLRAGDLEKATAEMTKARDLRPDYASVHLALAAMLRQGGDEQGAQKELGRAMAESANEAPVLVLGEPGQTIFVDGKIVGYTPGGAFVNAGKHHLKVMSRGKAPQTAEITADPEQLTAVQSGPELAAEQTPLSSALPTTRAARSFALRDQSNHYWRSFQHFHSRPVVLLFWHEGNPANADTLQALSGLGAAFGEKIGCAVIHTDVVNKNQALSQMMSLPATYARLFDDGSVTRWYGLSAEQLPAVVLVDLDGYIAAQGQGVEGVARVREALKAMLAQ